MTISKSTGRANPLIQSPPVALEQFMSHRYGAFIHWNPATLAGGEVSWTRELKIPHKEYDELYKRFNPEKFDAENWVRILKDGGFRYLTFVSKHHDGFAMWDTKTTDYNIMNSPFGRDVIGEIALACQKLDLPLCLYYSIADFYHPDCIGAAAVDQYAGAWFREVDPTKPITDASRNHGPPGYSLPRGQKPDFERYVRYMKEQLRELTEAYGPVLGWWFDGCWQKAWTYERGVDLLKYMRSLQPDTLCNQRIGGAFNKNVYVPTWFPTEQGYVGDYAVLEVDMPRFNREIPWEYTNPANNRSYSWSPGPYGDPDSWIANLVKSVCGDGNFILGVSAPPTGCMEPELIDGLKTVNAWLRTYGESVYGTRGGVYKRTSVYGSTCKDNVVYLHVFGEMTTKLVLPPLPATILRSRMLNGGQVKVTQTKHEVTVEINPHDFQTPTTIVVLELDGSAELITPIGETPVNHNVAVRSSNKDPSNDHSASDGNISTFWRADGSTAQPWLEYDLGCRKSISRAILFEGQYEGQCANIHKMQIEVLENGCWNPVTEMLSAWGNGEPVFDDWPISIRYPEIRFGPVRAQHIRLTLVRVTNKPVIHQFELFGR